MKHAQAVVSENLEISVSVVSVYYTLLIEK